jgi:3-oxoacyl-[acyl-carrier-protein] synthase-3
MKAIFKNFCIEGICSVVPSNEINFDDEISNYNFTVAQTKKLKLAFGLNTRRVAPNGVCSSDLAVSGLQAIFDDHPQYRNSIGAIFFISQTPDYIIPPTSNLIQTRLGLPSSTYCIDINQGCAGFIIGLFQAYQLLASTNIDKVAIITADVLSSKVSERDRNSRPLIGDAATVTIVGRTNREKKSYFNIMMDGKNAMALCVPAGAARIPYSSETSKMSEDEAGNFRSLNHLVMKGDAVFNFVQTEIPPLINETIQYAGLLKNDIDYYFFHQPNDFMLRKLCSALNINFDKMPNELVGKYGNSSGSTIPIVITRQYLNEKFDNNICCLSGFGVGLTWGSVIMEMDKFNFCILKEF